MEQWIAEPIEPNRAQWKRVELDDVSFVKIVQLSLILKKMSWEEGNFLTLEKWSPTGEYGVFVRIEVFNQKCCGVTIKSDETFYDKVGPLQLCKRGNTHLRTEDQARRA